MYEKKQQLGFIPIILAAVQVGASMVQKKKAKKAAAKEEAASATALKKETKQAEIEARQAALMKPTSIAGVPVKYVLAGVGAVVLITVGTIYIKKK